ncbi:MAG: hypothetical protein AAFO94_23155, partial [Bacteroidota bacterium]
MPIQNILSPVAKAIAASVLLNVVIFYIGKQFGWIDFEIPVSPDGQTFSLTATIFASVVPIVVAGLVYWGITKVAKEPW